MFLLKVYHGTMWRAYQIIGGSFWGVPIIDGDDDDDDDDCLLVSAWGLRLYGNPRLQTEPLLKMNIPPQDISALTIS